MEFAKRINIEELDKEVEKNPRSNIRNMIVVKSKYTIF